MNNALPSEADCKRNAARLNEILPEVFDYARRKRLTGKPFAEYDRLRSVWGKYPEGWEDSVPGMLAVFPVCGRTKTCAAFVRSLRDRLPNSEIALARQWRTLPWIWSGFKVTEDLGGSIVEVRPLGDRPGTWPEHAEWGTLTVYSPTVVNNLHRGIELFLTQLVPIGGIFHTYGTILAFQSFDATDLFVFADTVRCSRQINKDEIEPLTGIAGRAGNLSDIIASNPLAFLRLFEFTEMPELVGRVGAWRKNASVVFLSEDVDMKNSEYWEKVMRQGDCVIHSQRFLDDSAALYLDGGSPMYDPAVYISFPDRRIYLSAGNDNAYQIGRKALLPVVRFPDKPDVGCSLLVSMAVKKILDTADVLELLQNKLPPVEEQVDVDEEETAEFVPTMDEARKVLDRLVHNHNEGLEDTDSDIAQELNVVPEIVAKLRKTVETVGPGPQNRLPDVDWMGLSPRQVHDLLRNPIPSSPGAIALRDVEDFRALGDLFLYSLRDVPIVRFAEWFLTVAGNEGRIPATKAGYVKPALVTAAGEAGVILSPEERVRRMFKAEDDDSEERLARLADFLRPKREADSIEFLRNRELLETSGFVRLAGGAFEVTETGRLFLDDTVALYLHILATAFQRYEWYETGRMQSLPGMRDRAGFLLYALHVLCGGDRSGHVDVYKWVPVGSLTEAFLRTYPEPAGEIIPRDDSATSDFFPYAEFSIRLAFASFFGDTLGLIETRADESDFSWLLRPTPLLQQVFKIG